MSRHDCTPSKALLLLERRSLIGMHHRQQLGPADDLVESARTFPMIEGRVRR
jgi:hypothetical protein